MFHLWLNLRRLRRRATPLSKERGAIELFLREKGVFASAQNTIYSFARVFTAATVIVLILSASVSSYAYASETVLPDTPLYSVREVIEQVEVKLAVTPVQKQKVADKLVERRKQEVKKLTELKRPVPVKLQKFLRKELKQEVKQVPTKKSEKQPVRLQRARNPMERAASTTLLLVPRGSSSTTEQVRLDGRANDRKQATREAVQKREEKEEKNATQSTLQQNRRKTNLQRLRERIERLRDGRKAR
ncbi:hypothetical protein KBD34_05155 [Patescibacteria group bacterium]|nr:hypothetical protein [Patescibacteria group bacterium]